MPAARFFVDETIAKGGEILLKGDEAHHLLRVMRATVGEEIELINGTGILAKAVIKSLSKDTALCSVVDIHVSHKRPSIILAQAIPRFNRLEYILEKATELNVLEFWLFPAKLSEKAEFSKNQQERMQMLVIAAMKQSGRLDLPKIVMKPALQHWKKQEGTILFGDTREKAPYLWEAIKKPLETPSIFVIGPESGLHEKEVDFLENSLGALGVKLHDNILRVDTAPVVALSLLQLELWV